MYQEPPVLARQILQRSDAAMQLDFLQSAMEDEKRRRREFREWVDETIKAEFINGQTIVHSPVSRRYWKASSFLSTLLNVFARLKDVGEVGVEKTMIALTRNDYEPDLVFFSKEKADAFTDEQVLFPAPDFVVEILSKKTASTDRGTKKADYATHGIREYWIVDPTRQRIEQYILPTDGMAYFPAKVYQGEDLIESHAISGFNIPVSAIFSEAANLAALQEWLNG